MRSTSRIDRAGRNVSVCLCRLDELPDPGARGFDPFEAGRDTVFLVRRGESVLGYQDECPHQGARLPWRRHAYLSHDRDRIVCSAHGAQFDIATGRCLLGPCLGESLQRVEIEVSADGKIHLLGVGKP